MKKSKYVAITAAVLIAIAAAPSQARQNNYQRAYPSGYGYNQNFNAWNAAALGAAVGVVIGVGSQYNRFTATPPLYPRVVNVYPPAAPPYGQFYSLPVPCRTAQIPVYDQYGRLVQYQQTCVN
ncbi:MAG: hypothetical protein NWQ00_04540 [Burkholderiaceae bacterium]|jgi:hypothetical protein|nr:hypothetical protein [Burkholderiaceae bacterium]MDP4969187.1 hypothetical protein [Burkholderiaceae bacterium]MDP5111692.1 hypothetical protein [Burkholderiaceae bacterium]